MNSSLILSIDGAKCEIRSEGGWIIVLKIVIISPPFHSLLWADTIDKLLSF